MSAETTAAPAATRLDRELLLELRLPSDVEVSPDGSHVAFTLSSSFNRPGQGPSANVWMVEPGQPERQATFGPGVDQLPRFSPDGERLAFLSDRDHRGRLGVYLLGGGGLGESRAVGEVPGSVEDVRWAPDGQTLLVLAADIGSDRAGAQAATKIGEADAEEEDPRVTRPWQTWRRLYSVAVEDGATTEVSPEGVNVWEVDWRGSARAVAICSADPSESGWYDAWLGLLDLDSRTAEKVYEPGWQVQSPRLSPDGSRAAVLEGFSSDRGTLTGTITIVELAGGAPRPLAPELDATWLAWSGDDTLAFGAWRGLGSACGTVSLDGRVEELYADDVTIGNRYGPRLGTSADGTVLAAAIDAPGRPTEVFALEPSGPRALTAFNAALGKRIGPAGWERFGWTAPDGLEIEGVLGRPPRSNGPAPLVVFVHGGPTANWSLDFTPSRGLGLVLLDAGYAVLMPNPRGSSGRGQEFARANLGDMGGGDLQDILAGVDALVEAGIADDDRVAITGGSYGGFMAAWAITQSDRFAASIPLACVSNWLSFHNTTNIGQFDVLYLDSDPYDAGGEYPRRSPVMQAGKARTPTLILHGEQDLCTPVGQAKELYQALVEAGCETELVVYPREGHGMLEHDHLLDLWSRIVDWLDRHLGDS